MREVRVRLYTSERGLAGTELGGWDPEEVL